MSKNKIVVLSIVGILMVLLVWIFMSYNGFVMANELVNNQWAQVETQYQRRADLIPNLVSTVSGAADFEQETFTAVTQARSNWQNAVSREQQIEAAGSVDSALSRLLVTVENYPQLQATAAFRDLMAQLEGTENRISVARKDYNEAVQLFNVKVKSFPGFVLAGIFGFEPQEFFESQEGAEIVPDVEF